MDKKNNRSTFPFVIAFYVIMMISYSIGLISILINGTLSAEIPYEVVGWFWVAVCSIYVGGTALLNIFMSRRLCDLNSVDTCRPKLKRVAVMNYFAAVYCIVLVILGLPVPLEAIISAAGAVTVLAITGKKVSETIVESSLYDREREELEEELEELKDKIADMDV